MSLQKITLILISILGFPGACATKNPAPLTQNEFYSKVLNSEKFVVVKFFGSWCPTKDVKIDDMAFGKGDRSNIEFYDVDIEKESELAKQYGIKGAPTIVYFKGGKVMGKTEGYMRKGKVMPEIKKMYKKCKNLKN